MRSLAGSTLIFSALTFLSRITGLVRLMVFTYAIGGLTTLADAYQLAYLIPSTVYEFIAGGLLSAVFIPILVEQQQKSGKTSAEAWQVANLLLGAVAFVLALASVLALVLAPYIVDGLTLMAEGPETAAKRELATTLLRFFAPQMLLLGINAVFMAILNSHSVFAVTGAAPVINNLVIIATLFLFRQNVIGPNGLAIGTTLGTAAMAAVQLPWLLKLGMPIRPRLHLQNAVFGSVAKLGGPVVLVSFANLGGWAVRSNLLSTVLGAFAIYTICFQLVMMPYGIFAVAIATVLYPALSRSAADQRFGDFAREMSMGFRWTAFIMFPVAAGLSVLALPITQTLFEHRGGAFRYADSLFTANFLRLYALSIFPYALVMFATRVFYAFKDTRSPAWINIAGVVINIVSSYLLLKTMGVTGIAVAAVLTYCLTTLASIVLLQRKVGGMQVRELTVALLKIGVSTALMALAVSGADRYTSPSVVALERGHRFTPRLPENAGNGTHLLLTNPRDFSAFWKQLGLDERNRPELAFNSESVVVLIGPATATTSSLSIVRAAFPKTDQIALQVNITKSSRAAATAEDSVTSPAYIIAKVNRPLSDIQSTFAVGATAGPMQRLKTLLSGEIPRLFLLLVIGLVVYLGTAVAVGSHELSSLVREFKRRFKSKTQT